MSIGAVGKFDHAVSRIKLLAAEISIFAETRHKQTLVKTDFDIAQTLNTSEGSGVAVLVPKLSQFVMSRSTHLIIMVSSL
jgi:hypothetical protein